MSRGLRLHAEALLRRELRRVPADQREAVEAACTSVTAAVVEGVLEDARDEPRLAAALASIYGFETRIAAWPVEAARRG